MKKVTHISYTFDKGGAAKAASNIINCLKKKKIKIEKYISIFGKMTKLNL